MYEDLSIFYSKQQTGQTSNKEGIVGKPCGVSCGDLIAVGLATEASQSQRMAR
jgi:hypothetical protein